MCVIVLAWHLCSWLLIAKCSFCLGKSPRCKKHKRKNLPKGFSTSFQTSDSCFLSHWSGSWQDAISCESVWILHEDHLIAAPNRHSPGWAPATENQRDTTNVICVCRCKLLALCFKFLDVPYWNILKPSLHIFPERKLSGSFFPSGQTHSSALAWVLACRLQSCIAIHQDLSISCVWTMFNSQKFETFSHFSVILPLIPRSPMPLLSQ